jgi:hypothetical protein
MAVMPFRSDARPDMTPIVGKYVLKHLIFMTMKHQTLLDPRARAEVS